MWFPIGPLWPGRQQGLNTHRFLSPRADELQHRLHPCFGDLRWVEQLPCKELPGTVLSMSPWTAKLLLAVLISWGRAGNSSLCIPAHFLFSRETALWSSISNSSIRKSQALDIRGTSPSRRIGEQTMIACPPHGTGTGHSCRQLQRGVCTPTCGTRQARLRSSAATRCTSLGYKTTGQYCGAVV